MLAITISAIISFVFDRISKILVLKYAFNMDSPLIYESGQSIPVIKDFFHLTFYGNKGVAFGMLSGKKTFLIIMCIVIIFLILLWVVRKKPENMLQKISIGMILGGAFGNIFDRISYGYVIDFLDFKVINYPIFNVADCAVVAGAVMFCIYIIFFEKKED